MTVMNVQICFIMIRQQTNGSVSGLDMYIRTFRFWVNTVL
jgi:hypothetical protein